jgi:hypothetical protein
LSNILAEMYSLSEEKLASSALRLELCQDLPFREKIIQKRIVFEIL